jgi:hypothetical protein
MFMTPSVYDLALDMTYACPCGGRKLAFWRNETLYVWCLRCETAELEREVGSGLVSKLAYVRAGGADYA